MKLAAVLLVAGTLASGAPFFFKHAPFAPVFVLAHAALLVLCRRFARFAFWAAPVAIVATAIVGAYADLGGGFSGDFRAARA